MPESSATTILGFPLQKPLSDVETAHGRYIQEPVLHISKISAKFTVPNLMYIRR